MSTALFPSLSNIAAAAIVALVSATASLEAQVARTWTGGAGDGELRTFGNYSPSGGANSNDLIFQDANLSVVLETGNSTPNSLHLTSAAQNFSLSSSSSRVLYIVDRITLDAGITATFDLDIGAVGNTVAATGYTLDIGEGSTLVLNGGMRSYSLGGTMVKTGAGTLYLGGSTASMLEGFTNHFREGTVELASGQTLGVPTLGPTGLMSIYIGSASTAASFKVDRVNATRARINGSLITASAANSRIETHNQLHVEGTLDVTAGATFSFTLGDAGQLTGKTMSITEQVVLELTGGDLGETYHLFNFQEVMGFDASKFTVTHDSFTNFNVTMSNGVISVQAIPEPRTAILTGMALLGGLLYRLRR